MVPSIVVDSVVPEPDAAFRSGEQVVASSIIVRYKDDDFHRRARGDLKAREENCPVFAYLNVLDNRLHALSITPLTESA